MPPRLALLVLLLTSAALGCGKQPAQTQPDGGNPPSQMTTKPVAPPNPAPPVPPNPTPKPSDAKPPAPTIPNLLTGKVVTLDLTPYGLRAVIDLPEGFHISNIRTGSFHIGYGKPDPDSGYYEYDLHFDMNSFSFREKKRTVKREPTNAIVDAADRYYFDRTTQYYTGFDFGRSFVLSGEQFLITSSRSGIPREAADALWKAIESIRQTEAQQKAEAARKAAINKLLRKGDDPDLKRPAWNNFDNELVVSLAYEVITPESVRLLKDIPDLHTVRFVGFDKFDKALFQEILEMANVRGVWLEGDWATDEVLAIVAVNPRITDVTLVRAGVTDKGFALLEKLPKLQMVALEFCEKITPAATKALRAKYPKLKLTNLR